MFYFQLWPKNSHFAFPCNVDGHPLLLSFFPRFRITHFTSSHCTPTYFTSCSFYASYFTILKPTRWLFTPPPQQLGTMTWNFSQETPFLNVSPASFRKSKIMNEKKYIKRKPLSPSFPPTPGLLQLQFSKDEKWWTAEMKRPWLKEIEAHRY